MEKGSLAGGQIVEEDKLRATHDALRQWAGKRQEPWRGLQPFAAELQMGHPAPSGASGSSSVCRESYVPLDKPLSWMSYHHGIFVLKEG